MVRGTVLGANLNYMRKENYNMAGPPKRRTKQSQKFNIGTWDAENEGEKIIIYGTSGMGKTTLASLREGVVFIGLDDGGRKIKDAEGKPLNVIKGVKTFQDVLDALQHLSKSDNKPQAIAIDTVTKLQDLAEPWVFKHVPGPRNKTVKNLEGYGYNKGYRHLYDAMRKVLEAADGCIRQGIDIILIAQSIPNRIANPAGEDFLKDIPHLYAGKPSIASLYVEWADHVAKIDYQNMFVSDEDGKPGKVSGSTERGIFVQPEVYYIAKSRTIDEKVISFQNKQDNSFWEFLA